MGVLSDAVITALAKQHSHDLASYVPPCAMSESSNSAAVQEELNFWTRLVALNLDSGTTAIAQAKVTAVTGKQAAHGMVVVETSGGVSTKHYVGTTVKTEY